MIIITLCIVVPPNGLVIYCGTIVTDEGKEKKVNIDFEPFRPINTSLYLCDNKFHTEVCVLFSFIRFLKFDKFQYFFVTNTTCTRSVGHNDSIPHLFRAIFQPLFVQRHFPIQTTRQG